MESLIPIAVWLVLALIGLSLVAIAIFAVRNLTFGKVNALTIGLTFIPIALLVVLGFATGDWWYAGVIVVIVMLVITSITLLLSGIRGLIGL
jgi:hypothetical protein